MIRFPPRAIAAPFRFLAACFFSNQVTSNSLEDEPKDEKPKKKVVRTSLDIALAAAKKTQGQYEAVKGKFASLESAIDSQEAWLWAKDTKTVQPLIDAAENLERAMSSFDSEFMHSDMRDLRASYDSAHLETRCDEMRNKLTSLIDIVNKEAKSLVAMQQARSRILQGGRVSK